MGFTSVTNAAYSLPLVKQFVAIVQRDMQAALDAVAIANGGVGGQYPSFNEYNFATLPVIAPPELTIVARSVTVDVEASQQFETRSGIEISCVLIVAETDRNRLAEGVQNYARALSWVIETAGNNLGADQSSFYIPLPLKMEHLGQVTTVPLANQTVLYFRMVGQEFGPLLVSATDSYLQAASVKVVSILSEI